MSWYRTHRPRQISELHTARVKAVFEPMVKSGKWPQVFLFAGPRGTGKTSTARILAAKFNGFKGEKKPVKELESIFAGNSYLVTELDAASHRGIDDVRSLQEQVLLPPRQGEKSVIILDEVHMLTKEAFNALLKLLEEPPTHVVFILATTELHQVPDTVKSRCSIVHFVEPSQAEILVALENVSKLEKLKVGEEVLEAVADSAQGSFRDGIKLLEQLNASGELSLENLKKIAGVGLSQGVVLMFEAVVTKNAENIFNQFQNWRDQGVRYQALLKKFVDVAYVDLKVGFGVESGKSTLSKAQALYLLELFRDLPPKETGALALLPLELALIKVVDKASGKKTSNQTSAIASNKPETTKKKAKNTKLSENSLKRQWPDVIDGVTQKNAALGSVLKASTAVFADGELVINTSHKFHQEQLEQVKFQDIVSNVLEQVFGKVVPWKPVAEGQDHKDIEAVVKEVLG